MNVLAEAKVEIRIWARSVQTVRRAWLYGGWIREPSRPHSDIDIALELLGDVRLTARKAEMDMERRLRPEIMNILKRVHVKLYDPDVLSNKIVREAVDEHGELLYSLGHDG